MDTNELKFPSSRRGGVSIMARRNLSKCKCGAKLSIKKGHKICYVCDKKERKQSGLDKLLSKR